MGRAFQLFIRLNLHYSSISFFWVEYTYSFSREEGSSETWYVRTPYRLVVPLKGGLLPFSLPRLEPRGRASVPYPELDVKTICWRNGTNKQTPWRCMSRNQKATQLRWTSKEIR